MNFTILYGQNLESKYTVFDSRGNQTDFSQIINAVENSDVVFLGEQHDDSTTHALQMEIFKSSFEKSRNKKHLILSLEMFERDVQTVVDEYLNNLISEQHFLSSTRPWGNYKTDYRPLVEFAKKNKIPVIAANAPRRYVNMVSRLGKDSLNSLSPEARKWIAPLPFKDSSETYKNKFNALMGGMPATGAHNGLVDSQTLWDATMAHSISNALKNHKNSLVINLNGSFHSESHLGTVEQLLRYRPNTKILVVTMKYENNFKTFDKSKHSGLGDFVILTDAKQPRSQR